ncbi:MAG: hypothetical protein JWN77_854 [Frankiales bacterium]|nr:hypothetical protein [Frankiales bacterium]
MKPSRLLVLPALALLASPLLTLPSEAATTSAAPTFRQYHGPSSARDVRGNTQGADNAGEPTLGFNPKTGNVLFMANKNTYRVNGFDLTKDDKATWTDVTEPVEGAQTSDPILWRDPTTNRTFINQLELQGGSLQAFTDDDGKTYTRSIMGGSIGIAFDHQTVVTGKPAPEGNPYPQPINYPNYVYYCTNDLYGANCAVSIDGGLNFLVATPVYTGELAGGPCAAIFGHIKTDPRDGTLYLPPNGCDGKQMLFVSRDNSFTWTGYTVPGSTDGDAGHPAVDVGRQDGAVYYAWGSKDGTKGTGRTHVATSFDKGKTWRNQTALGADLGIVTSRFPVVAAGDKGRAAVTFIGAKVEGDPNLAPDATSPNIKPYTGVWDLYVSYTMDGGKTWKTYDATPKDPVQRGPVCTKGTTCLAGRNLLDFNDMVIDDKGFVAIALADGSPTGKESYTADASKATIVRQVGGPSLYAQSVTKPVAAPRTAPAAPTSPSSPRPAGGTLPTTGLATALPGLGLLLLLGVAFSARRRVTR